MDSMSFGGRMPLPRGRGEITDNFAQDNAQGRLPFQPEDPRGPAVSESLASMQADQVRAMAEAEQRERVVRAAKALEDRFKAEVEASERKTRRHMMYLGGAVAVLLAFVYWRLSSAARAS